jgi:cytoskeletal protein CcmA (bactofilin family)
MFSSKSKAPESPAPSASSGVPVKRGTRSSAPSIISADLVVTGMLTSTGDIQIDGRVEGDVRSSGLVIGDKAFIQGEVLADDVTVRGRIQGGIRARKVLLCATSHVEGNILHEAFAVEAGAFFEGNCRHSDNPLSEENGRKVQEFQVKPAAAPATMPSSAGMPSSNGATPVAMAPKPPEPMRPAPAATFAPLKSGG